MATAPKPKLAPAASLKREIQAALTDELASERHRTGHGRYDGFAYPAAEAYFHLAGGRCLSRVSDFRRDLKVIQQSSCDGSTGLAVAVGHVRYIAVPSQGSSQREGQAS